MVNSQLRALSILSGRPISQVEELKSIVNSLELNINIQ